MFVLFLFLIIALILFLNSQNFFDAKDLLESATYIVAGATIIIFVFLYIGDFSDEVNPYNLFFAPFFAFGIYYIINKCKPKDLKVFANQQRYFNEVKADDVYRFYSDRKEVKNNRVEIFVNREEKKLVINDEIVPSFFMDYFSIELSEIKSINELENNKLFKILFTKIKGFAKDLELTLNYEKILEENDFKAEFFIMDLWERVTPKFNIGLANLEILAENEKELNLIWALDLINLNNVKQKGAALYYKFTEFKGRVELFAKESDIQS